VLIGENIVCKVASLGSSRELTDERKLLEQVTTSLIEQFIVLITCFIAVSLLQVDRLSADCYYGLDWNLLVYSDTATAALSHFKVIYRPWSEGEHKTDHQSDTNCKL